MFSTVGAQYDASSKKHKKFNVSWQAVIANYPK